MNYADDSLAEATGYQMRNLYSNAQLQAAVAASSNPAPYALRTVKRVPPSVGPSAGDMRVGLNLSQVADAGGVTILGRFVPYWQLGVGAAALVGAYFVFGKKKRGRRR